MNTTRDGAIRGLQTYQTMEELGGVFLREHPDHFSLENTLKPTELIAGGSGFKFEYIHPDMTGTGEFIRVLPGVMLAFHEVIYRTAASMERFFSSFDQQDDHVYIRMMQAGSFSFDFGEQEFQIHPGDIFINRYPINQSVKHGCEANIPYRYIVAYTSEKGLAETSRRLAVPVPDVVKSILIADEPAQMAYAFHADQELQLLIQSFWNRRTAGAIRTAMLRHKIAELFCFLSEDSLKTENTSIAGFSFTDLRRLREARELLGERFANPPTIPELSREIGLNRRKLTEGFRALFGISVAEHTAECRMQHAYTLLTTSDLGLAEVAEACGYEHLSNFSKAFKKRFEENPSQLRRD